jgi:hypothetical protein
VGKDYELYLTVGESVPYVEVFVKAVKILEGIYEFGKQSEEEQAIAALQQHVADLRADLTVIKAAVDALARRQAQNENLDRWRQVTEHRNTIEDLSFQLAQNPDVDELASIAHSASLRVATMLEDEDLWQWSDIGIVKLSDGRELAELAPAEFNPLLALPTFSAAVALFVIAADRHLSQAPGAIAPYGERFARFHGAVSMRPEYIDQTTQPLTLPERIRQKLWITGAPKTKYAVDGDCTFNLYLHNRIEKSSRFITEVSFAMHRPQGSTAPILCTYSPEVIVGYEGDAEDDYQPIRLLRVLEEMLERMRVHGSLSGPRPPMSFPNETLHNLTLYAIEPDGNLRQYNCKMWTSLKDPAEWTPKGAGPVGTGWHEFKQVLGGAWNVLYAVKRDNSILWYRHDGAEAGAFHWPPPRTVAAAYPSTAQYIAGGRGDMFRVTRESDGLRTYRALSVLRHPGVEDGTGAFGRAEVVTSDWPKYESVFGGPNGVIYGIDVEGRLFWHRWLGGKRLVGPFQVGTGWNGFARVFATEGGFLFGVYPNGEMLAYNLTNSHTEHPLPPIWKGPVRIPGTHWNGQRALIPILDTRRPHVL